MFKKLEPWRLFVVLSVVTLGVGCDFATKRQQAEDARRAAEMARLKRVGEAARETRDDK